MNEEPFTLKYLPTDDTLQWKIPNVLTLFPQMPDSFCLYMAFKIMLVLETMAYDDTTMIMIFTENMVSSTKKISRKI